jgi:hypothetical protein
VELIQPTQHLHNDTCRADDVQIKRYFHKEGSRCL